MVLYGSCLGKARHPGHPAAFHRRIGRWPTQASPGIQTSDSCSQEPHEPLSLWRSSLSVPRPCPVGACPTHHVFGFWAGLTLSRLSLPFQVTPLSSDRARLGRPFFIPAFCSFSVLSRRKASAEVTGHQCAEKVNWVSLCSPG